MTRIYAVAGADKTRLVRASHPSAALAHVVKSTFTCRVASQDDLVSLVASGVAVEDAAIAPQAELPIQE